MTAIEAQLLARLKELSPDRVAEVMDFVDFLTAREERAAAMRRLTAGLTKLDALQLPPLNEDEIDAEIQAMRRRRQGRAELNI